MPFGVINALAFFIYFMNKVFKQCLDLFVIVFINDILIYTRSEKNMQVIWELIGRLSKIASYSLSEVNMSSGCNTLLFLGTVHIGRDLGGFTQDRSSDIVD